MATNDFARAESKRLSAIQKEGDDAYAEYYKLCLQHVERQEERIDTMFDYIRAHGRPYSPSEDYQEDMICLYFTKNEFINYCMRIRGDLEYDPNIALRMINR